MLVCNQGYHLTLDLWIFVDNFTLIIEEYGSFTIIHLHLNVIFHVGVMIYMSVNMFYFFLPLQFHVWTTVKTKY